MNKMGTRPHPNLIVKFEIQMSQVISGDQTAIDYAAGEMRLFWSKQSMPQNGMNSVSSYKSVNRDQGSVFKMRFDTVAMIH